MSFGYSFYRGEHTNFGPTQDLIERPDAIAKFFLKGWMPEEPFIDENTNIIAFGSCFASNISNYLNNIGYNVATKKDNVAYVSRLGDGIVNTHAIRQQFEWAWENHTPAVDLWHGYKAEEFGYDEQVRLKTKELFDEADLFIITLGLSEVWYDEPTGEVFWRAVPFDKFDPSRHKFRVATHEESLTNLRAIYSLIRKHKPDTPVVFTVSPIPLAATFRDVSCITANAVSKAILRSAIDQLYRENKPNDPKLFYFPSYEIVLNAFRNQFGKDGRHVHPHVLHLNMQSFERYFCRTGLTDADIENTFSEALALDKELGGEDKANALRRIRSEKLSQPRNVSKHIVEAARERTREERQKARGRETKPDAATAEQRAAEKAARREQIMADRRVERRQKGGPDNKAE
ncbi:hypothetical protein DKG74_14735 [Zavarzinia aquatilis]|uniref:GSCFA domain-containing protein n=2 Tax=Zavarzinia aquatilis TaxID=2211142 RepID=A0A317E3R1_9PROT|nr:hypothetical protein DKG74_14735 [Zavarzinia aquatilis]